MQDFFKKYTHLLYSLILPEQRLKLDQKQNRLLNIFWGLTLLGIILLVTPLRIASIYLIVFLFAAISTHIIRGKIGILTRIVLAFLVLGCTQQLVGLITWLLKLPFYMETYLFSLYLFIAVILLWFKFKSIITLFDIGISRSDLIATLFAIGSTAIIIVGTFHSGGASESQLIRFIVRGFDSSTHLSLVMSVYDERSYLYGPPSESLNKNAVASNLFFAYPQGWHFMTATTWRYIDNSLSYHNMDRLLEFFFVTFMVWYFTITFLAGRLILLIYSLLTRATEQTPNFIVVISVALWMYIIQATSLLAIARFGFINYIALICYILGIGLILILTASGQVARRHFVILGLLFSAGAACTWLLAAPIGYLAVFFAILPNLKKTIRDSLISWRRYFFVGLLVVIIGISTLLQIYFQVAYGDKLDNLNVTTVIWPTEYTLLGLLSVGLLIAFSKKIITLQNRRIVFALLAYISAASIAVGLIYIYQYVTVGKTGYYFDKLAAIPAIILICICGAFFTQLVSRLHRYFGAAFVLLLIVTTAIALPVLSHTDIKELRFAAGGDRQLSAQTADKLSSLIKTADVTHNNILVLRGRNYEEDVITTHFLNSISRKEDYCSSLLGSDIISRAESLSANIRECAKRQSSRPFFILTSPERASYWRAQTLGVYNIQIIVTG